ncbi:MAG: hypothetical protein IPJ11_16740, partial [Gemmatimonadetes bacterium]|nr:hypothetical protein [Gemmatimonadota bacterium]
MARDHRLGHRLGPIYEPTTPTFRPRLGRRDPPAQPGLPDGVELASTVPHTVIVDNAGGLLMRQGKVDACIVGTDRTTRTGDVANKIGTLPEGARRQRQRHPVLRGGTVVEHRLG